MYATLFLEFYKTVFKINTYQCNIYKCSISNRK